MESNGMGRNWQAHNNSHHPPVPRENRSELQHMEQMVKSTYSCDIRTTTGHLQLTTQSWETLSYGWQVTFTALPCVSHCDWLLWEATGSSPAGLQLGSHRHKRDWGVDWVSSPTQFSKSHILTQPLSPVVSYGPFSLLLRTTILSLLSQVARLPGCQVAWPGNTAEAAQRNCSICTFSSAAATLLPTALLQVCCCDVLMKTCQIFPTINPGVQQRLSLPTDLTSLGLPDHHGYSHTNIPNRRAQLPQ